MEMGMKIRKVVTWVEEMLMDGGGPTARPIRRAAAAAIIENPFAGQFIEDLSPLIAASEELGKMLAERAVQALGGGKSVEVESYGKAAIVGVNGEVEHAAALLHPKF